jgi:hypothetical protein
VKAIMLASVIPGLDSVHEWRDDAKGASFKQFVMLDDALHDPRIRYLVFHVNPVGEYGADGYNGLFFGTERQYMALIRQKLNGIGVRLLYRDERIEVYRKNFPASPWAMPLPPVVRR